MPRTSLRQASAALAARDPVMARLHRAAGPCRLAARAGGDAFAALARSIVYQQLAGSAAAAIHARLATACGRRVTAPAVLALAEPHLAAVGLSRAKRLAIRDLAAKHHERVVDLDRLARLRDERVVEELTRVRGIGRWTAQMFLMFHLRRMDVWPVLDLGVRKGYARAYGLAAAPSSRELEELGERFRPFRSVAAWYLWRALELPDGDPLTAPARR